MYPRPRRNATTRLPIAHRRNAVAAVNENSQAGLWRLQVDPFTCFRLGSRLRVANRRRPRPDLPKPYRATSGEIAVTLVIPRPGALRAVPWDLWGARIDGHKDPQVTSSLSPEPEKDQSYIGSIRLLGFCDGPAHLYNTAFPCIRKAPSDTALDNREPSGQFPCNSLSDVLLGSPEARDGVHPRSSDLRLTS